MKEYAKFEKVVVSTYKRNLISFDEAINKISGYLQCMVDIGIIEFDRATEEMNLATKKLLDSE